MDTHDLFWTLATELQAKDPRIVEGTIMSGRCLRVDKEFLALVDYKGSGLVAAGDGDGGGGRGRLPIYGVA